MAVLRAVGRVKPLCVLGSSLPPRSGFQGTATIICLISSYLCEKNQNIILHIMVIHDSELLHQEAIGWLGFGCRILNCVCQ